jgi:hypothetical protein
MGFPVFPFPLIIGTIIIDIIERKFDTFPFWWMMWPLYIFDYL